MVYVLLAPGFEEAEAVVPVDLLRRAEVETKLVSLSGTSVTGSHGITMQTDLTLEQVTLKQEDMLFLPGGLPGVDHLWADERVSQLIQTAAQQGSWIAAICAAPVLLSRYGLLDGRKATSYPTRQNQLGKAEVQPHAPVVVDGTFITGQACGSAFEFGLKLVEVLCGAEQAAKIKEQICFHCG